MARVRSAVLLGARLPAHGAAPPHPTYRTAPTRRRPITPVMLDFAVQAGDKSMYNTPPCWSIYMAGLTFAKLRKDGGLPAVLAANEKVGWAAGGGLGRVPGLAERGGQRRVALRAAAAGPAAQAAGCSGAPVSRC